jgi:hypothetical protein
MLVRPDSSLKRQQQKLCRNDRENASFNRIKLSQVSHVDLKMKGTQFQMMINNATMCHELRVAPNKLYSLINSIIDATGLALCYRVFKK